MQRVLDWFALASPWELVAVVLALAYVILAVKKSMWCWLAAIVSSAIYVVLMIESRLYMEAALNVFYIAMAVYGYWEWQRGRAESGDMAVERFALRDHFAALGTVALLSAVNGYVLAAHTDAARPYVDSFITWGSVVTTWMVARRVAENWLYWIVFDAIAAILYFQQGRTPTGVLFLIYVAIAVQGFRAWLRKPELSPAVQIAE